MLIDARSLPQDGAVLQSEVCIVGAGPAGITLAREFLQSGISVNVFEAGDLEYDERTQTLYEGETVGSQYYPLDTARLRQFAGSTNHLLEHGLRSRPLDAADFEVRDWMPHSGWPFNRAHLDPFYERAQVVCGLGPFDYDAGAWLDEGEACLTSQEGSIRTTVFQFGHRDVFRDYRTELETSPDVSVYLNANVVEIECDDNTGAVSGLRLKTLTGATIAAKSGVYILAAGGIENPRLMLQSNARHAGGIGNQNDLVGRFFTEHLHLYSGILVPNNRAQISEASFYLQQERRDTEIMGVLALDPEVREREQIANVCMVLHPEWRAATTRGALAVRETLLATRQRRFHGGLLRELQHLLTSREHQRSFVDLMQPVNVVKDSPGIASAAFRKFSRRNRGSKDVLQLSFTVEQFPNPESRVTLSRKTDRLGQPRVRLDWRVTDQDLRTVVRAERMLDEQVRREGWGHIESMYDEQSPPRISGQWHHTGTTRMHDDPRRGVVDADCRVHGIANLYVAGSSVFPTTGFANPTLTLVALAIRLADHLKRSLSAKPAL